MCDFYVFFFGGGFVVFFFAKKSRKFQNMPENHKPFQAAV